MNNETKKARIAFTVIQDDRGFYQVLNEVNEPIEVERQTTLMDIKTACGEIREALLRNEAINAVLSILEEKNAKTDSVDTNTDEVSTLEDTE